MRRVRSFVLAAAAALGALAGAVWAGLRVRPQPFTSYPAATPRLTTVEPPVHLPEPVARFVRVALGERVPVIDTAVISGRGWLRFGGIKFPARWRFIYKAGEGYRHYIEATLFGQPVLKVNESYLDGHSRLELPFGVVENEPKIDHAANLGLWAESIWLPAIWFTDPRVRWEPIDDRTARLIVPFGDQAGSKYEVFTVWFDPDTGLLKRMVTLRWRDAADEKRHVWINEAHAWMTAAGMQIPSHATVTWEDQGKPWFSLEVDEAVYNVDVDAAIRSTGL